MKLKHLSITLAGMLFCTAQLFANCCNNTCDKNGFSYTTFKPRQITLNNVYQNNLSLYWWYRKLQCRENPPFVAFDITPFYQRTTRAKDLAQYYLPCRKDIISVQQDGLGDIGSIWWGLEAAMGQSFSRLMSIRPQRNATGAMLNFRFDLSDFVCNTWSMINFAVAHAKHNINLCEVIPNPMDPNPGVLNGLTSVTQAVNQAEWNYGKISCKPQERNGIDDLQLRFGYDWYFCDENHISPYFVFTVPLGERTCPAFLFEPLVGTHETSLGFGLIGDYLFWECCDDSITILTDLKYRYVLQGCEKRSFDLCENGDWSRYLLVAKESDCDSVMNGINLFTQDAKVTPGSVVDWWLAMHIQRGNWAAEMGYDFWWRQAEKIQLCDLPENWGIYDLTQSCVDAPATASDARICQSNVNNVPTRDAEFTQVTASDINCASGATPRAYSNTVYGALGYDGELCNMPILLGAGGMFQFGEKLRAPHNFAIWAKMGVAY